MKKILPVVGKLLLNEVLKPVAANLLRSLANILAGRKKKSANLDTTTVADVEQGTAGN